MLLEVQLVGVFEERTNVLGRFLVGLDDLAVLAVQRETGPGRFDPERPSTVV